MTEIKFKREHFDVNGNHITTTEWGYVDRKYNYFQSPASVSTEDKSKAVNRQYTGLKDKNSKEIYEGDILKIGNKRTKVIFKDGQFLTWDSQFSLASLLSMSSRTCEIIGDIYTNKDLLK